MKTYSTIRRSITLVILVMGLIYTTLGRDISPLAMPTEHTASATTALTTTSSRVVRVVDGDTLVVGINGTTTKVRLIGVNTPEVVDPRRPVQCFGKEASTYAKKILTNTSIYVETDSTQDTYDKYGRLLAYVYLPDGTLFNKQLIAEGYGYEYTYNAPYRFQSEFKLAQQSAQKNQKGLWAPNVCTHE